jgi:hypothetical protein
VETGDYVLEEEEEAKGRDGVGGGFGERAVFAVGGGGGTQTVLVDGFAGEQPKTGVRIGGVGVGWHDSNEIVITVS